MISAYRIIGPTLIFQPYIYTYYVHDEQKRGWKLSINIIGPTNESGAVGSDTRWILKKIPNPKRGDPPLSGHPPPPPPHTYNCTLHYAPKHNVGIVLYRIRNDLYNCFQILYYSLIITKLLKLLCKRALKRRRPQHPAVQYSFSLFLFLFF